MDGGQVGVLEYGHLEGKECFFVIEVIAGQGRLLTLCGGCCGRESNKVQMPVYQMICNLEAPTRYDSAASCSASIPLGCQRYDKASPLHQYVAG